MSLKVSKAGLSSVVLWFGSRLSSSDFLSPILRLLYDNVIRSLHRDQLFLIRGYVGNSNHIVTILVRGCKELVYSQAKRVCWGNQRVIALGKAFRWQNVLSDSCKAEIIMRCAPRQYRRKLEKNGYVLLPTVNFVLDLHGSVDDITKRASGRRRKSIKRLQNYDYSYAISRKNQKEFDYFYWNMYIPHAKSRFQKGAYIEPYFKLRKLYERKGGIAFVKHGNELISGILFYTDGKTVCAKVLGKRGGDYGLNDDCAGQAALFFLIKWAKSQRLSKLDYGLTCPFLRDGLFVYKKEWGMRLEHRGDNFFCYMKISRLNEGTLSFLEQNPFMFMDKEAMRALVLIDGEVTDVDMSRIVSAYCPQGLESFVVACRNTPIQNRITSDKGCFLPHLFVRMTEPGAGLLDGLRRRGFNISLFKLASENSGASDGSATEMTRALIAEPRKG